MLRVVLTSIIVPIFSQFIIAGKSSILPLKRSKYIYNVLTVILFYTMLNVIFWQYQINFLITITFFYLLSLTMYYVHEFRGTNINFSDILSINTAKEVASGYTYKIKPIFIIVFIIIVIEYVIHFFYYKIRVLENYHQVINGIDSRSIDVYRFFWHEFGQILFFLILFFLMRDIVSMNEYDYSLLAGEKEGYIYNFLSSISFFHKKSDIKEKIDDKEKTYDFNSSKSKTVFNVIDTKNAHNYDKVSIGIKNAKEELPNVIVIMNESFGSVQRRIKTNIPVTPYYDSLKGVVKGDLYVNTFGGGTANTEFEFLTGISIGNYPYPVMPYNNFVKRDKYSIARFFKSLGYETIAMHPYTATNYNRDKVYKRFGFDNLYFFDDFRDKKYIRNFVSDESMYEEVIRRYEEVKNSNRKSFIFGITMQNHSGYMEFDGEEVKADIKNSNEMNSYLSLLKKSDEAIKVLIDYFSKEKEPVIVLFFGDHNASFGTEVNKEVYDMDFNYECTNSYITPFFIYNNKKEDDRKINGVSANFLSIELLKEANLPFDMIHTYLNNIYKDYDIYSFHKMRSRKDMKMHNIKSTVFTKYEREYLN